MKNMKKLLALVLALALVFALAACGGKQAEQPQAGDDAGNDAGNDAANTGIAVAMVTDYGDITDQSFNQTTYEASKAWSEANGVKFTYKKPVGDSTPERVAMIETAIDEGYNVIVLPGFAFGEAIKAVAADYDDVMFVALDVSQADLGDDYVVPANVYCAVYQEELCGYMAGYAAVKLGYRHLGFLGGMAVPAVVRYGFGYVQGVNAAAEELGVAGDVTVEYVYGNSFGPSPDITAYMDNWYKNLNVECVFACGGGIYISAAEAAQSVGGKLIGVDVDQKGIIDAYADGMTVTSAMKGLAATVDHMLTEIKAGNFGNYGGKVETLGLVNGSDPAVNYVQLGTTQFTDDFTDGDYQALVAAMFDGKITVSNAIDAMPATTVTVNDLGSIS